MNASGMVFLDAMRRIVEKCKFDFRVFEDLSNFLHIELCRMMTAISPFLTQRID